MENNSYSSFSGGHSSSATPTVKPLLVEFNNDTKLYTVINYVVEKVDIHCNCILHNGQIKVSDYKKIILSTDEKTITIF